MEIVKKTEEYQIVKKRNGRYGVRRADRKWVTGEDKMKILIAEGLVKAPEPKADDTSTESDAGAEQSAEQAPDEAAEQSAGDDAKPVD